MAHGILLIKAYFPKKSQTDLVNALTQASHPRLLRATITNLLGSSSIGHGGVGLVAQAGSVAPVQATSSFTCTAASATVGDKLIILGPQGPITLTCVAANTENPFIGQYSVGGGTNNNLATSIRTAINSYPALRQIVSAAGSTNTVALTAVPGGGAGNLLKLVKQVTTSGVFSFTSGVAFSGGVDVSGSASMTVTVGTNPADADTLKFGNVTLTWKTAGSGENQVTIGVGTTASAAALAAAINAHSILGGIFSATSALGVVTITCTYPFLLEYLTTIVSSTVNVVVSGQAQSGATLTLASTKKTTAGLF